METVSREGLCGSRLAGDFRDEGATDEEFSGTRIEQTITLFVPFGSRKKESAFRPFFGAAVTVQARKFVSNFAS